MTDPPVPGAGQAYAEIISETLAEERSRKVSLEQRGVTVITTSSALVSLLFGFSALATRSGALDLPCAAVVLLVLALFPFVGAAILGVVVNWPRKYEEPSEESMRELLEEEAWNRAPHVAGPHAAELRLDVLKDARRVNRQKALQLSFAMACETAAVVLVGAAVAVILIAAHA